MKGLLIAAWIILVPGLSRAADSAAACTSMATFSRLMKQAGKSGMDSWFFNDARSAAMTSLLISQAQCHAFTEHSTAACDEIAFVKEFTRGEEARSCKTEHHWIEAHLAFLRSDIAAARLECGKWWDMQKSGFSYLIESKLICGALFEDPKAEPKIACNRLQSRVRSLLGSDAAMGTASMCLTYTSPTVEHCRSEMSPEPPDRCLARMDFLNAIKQKNVDLCPDNPRFESVCRAILDPKGAVKICDEVSLSFTKRYCKK